MRDFCDEINETLNEKADRADKSKQVMKAAGSNWISGAASASKSLKQIIQHGSDEEKKLAKQALSHHEKAWKLMKPFHDYVKGSINNYR